MAVDVTCGKCGEKITRMNMIRPLKDTLKHTGGKCPSCGQRLSATEFSFEIQERDM